MSKASQAIAKSRHYAKYLGFVLIIIGIPTVVLDSTSGSEIPLLVGLFTLLVTTDKSEDERSVQIKTTSLYIAFVISYGVKLITSNLFDHGLIAFDLTSVNHFLILMLASANVIYFVRLYVMKH
jgi:hypothetical protein